MHVACRLITRVHDLESSERRLLELQGRAPPLPPATHDAEQQTRASFREELLQDVEPLSADEDEEEGFTAQSRVQESADRPEELQYTPQSGEEENTPQSGEEDYTPRSGEQDGTPRSGDDQQTPGSGEEDFARAEDSTSQSGQSYRDPQPRAPVGVARSIPFADTQPCASWPCGKQAVLSALQELPKHAEQPAPPQRNASKAIRTSEHEAFAGHSLTAAEEKLAKESGMNNIVILNSLTHEQLVELLKVRVLHCLYAFY